MRCFEFSKYINVLAILGCEFCERLAYYGIGSSLTLYLRSHFGYGTDKAAICYTLWTAFATLFSVFGGYISDMYWGKKRTILVGVIIYACALSVVSLLTFIFDFAPRDYSKKATEIYFWIPLYAMMLGAGCIKSTVGLFGAAQLETIGCTQSEVQRLTESYWNWFYFAVSAGTLVSVTAITYLLRSITSTFMENYHH